MSIDTILCALQMDRLSRIQHRNRGLVLAYHNVIPDHAPRVGDTSLHIPRSKFGEQLDLLKETHEIVSLGCLMSGRPEETRGAPRRPCAAITFDDGYRGALTIGVEELVRRNLSATFFIAPGTIDYAAFWWDLLSDPAEGHLNPSVRNYALKLLKGFQPDILSWARNENVYLSDSSAIPEYARTPSEPLVRDASRADGVAIASHGWAHRNFTTLTASELEEELHRTPRWFDQESIPWRPWIAYPYGNTPTSIAAIRERTYDLGFTTAGTFLPLSASPLRGRYQVPRLNVPSNVSLKRYRLLTSGTVQTLRSFA